MNYYDEISNEITKKVKNCSKNESNLTIYYNVCELFADVGKHYGKAIIKEYFRKLTNDIGKGIILY